MHRSQVVRQQVQDWILQRQTSSPWLFVCKRKAWHLLRSCVILQNVYPVLLLRTALPSLDLDREKSDIGHCRRTDT